MDKLNLTGDGPLPSTDEESIFVGKDNAEGVMEDAKAAPEVVAIPAPGGGGSYPMPDE